MPVTLDFRFTDGAQLRVCISKTHPSIPLMRVGAYCQMNMDGRARNGYVKNIFWGGDEAIVEVETGTY